MGTKLTSSIDLHLAFKRIKAEPKLQSFVEHPYELQLIEVDAPSWLLQLEDDLREGRYNPGVVQIANAPKGKGHVRPGAFLSMRDRVVYYGLIGSILKNICAELAWPTHLIDYSYAISEDLTSINWMKDSYNGWSRFREDSLSGLVDRPYVVIADITGYYENVDLATLSSDLNDCGAPSDVVAIISACLNKWAQVSGRGIPQGQAASDILGKLYLNSVDQALDNNGFIHRRYVDDYRVFCKHGNEGKRVLIFLSQILRGRGLNLQSAKSGLHRASKARVIFDGITPTIEDVKAKYIKAILKELDLDPYTAWADVERILEMKTDETPVEVLRETFQSYFIDGDSKDFDKTLFHFLIKRLGKAKDRYALDYCIKLLESQPQETQYVLTYLNEVGIGESVIWRIALFLESPDAVYDYQNFLLIHWASRTGGTEILTMLTQVRKIAFETLVPAYLRSASRDFLAKFGNKADWIRLQELYSSTTAGLEQAELICCLRNMEKSRRNTFCGRVEGDGDWQRRAVKFIKTST